MSRNNLINFVLFFRGESFESRQTLISQNQFSKMHLPCKPNFSIVSLTNNGHSKTLFHNMCQIQKLRRLRLRFIFSHHGPFFDGLFLNFFLLRFFLGWGLLTIFSFPFEGSLVFGRIVLNYLTLVSVLVFFRPDKNVKSRF